MEYDLIDYFDVWGNEEDGWEVNNLARIRSNIHIDDDATDEGILDYLNLIGFFVNATTEDVTVEDLGDGFIELYQKSNGMPLGRLQKTN